MYKNIVLAYDGSESGRQALIDCKELAHWNHAELSLLAVMPYSLSVAGSEGSIFVPEFRQREVARYRAVLDARTHGANLIVVGHKHLDNWAARWWSGAISGDLIEHAHCSVMCVIVH